LILAINSFPEIIYLSISKEYASKYWSYIHTVSLCPLSRRLLELFPMAEISVYRTICVVTAGNLQAEYRLDKDLKQELHRWADYKSLPLDIVGCILVQRIDYVEGLC
jgi:hypothetical protein